MAWTKQRLNNLFFFLGIAAVVVMLLTFNFRETWLFLFCLLDVPVCHFLFEIVVMGLLWKYVNTRHENFCRQMADKL